MQTEVLVTIQRLNNRGYGVGFVEGVEYRLLNCLPGEVVVAKKFKQKAGIVYGQAEKIISQSVHRCQSQEEHFTSCSPWQILDFNQEGYEKVKLIKDAAKLLGIENAKIENLEILNYPKDYDYSTWEYRNKVEYGFFADENDILSFAFFMRDGNFGKFKHHGCKLYPNSGNDLANELLKILNQHKISRKVLKSLIIRHSFHLQKDILSLYVKDEDFPVDIFEDFMAVNSTCLGLHIIFSDPKSPAAKNNGSLLSLGSADLLEELDGKIFKYNFEHFFQVNPIMFSQILQDARTVLNKFMGNCESKTLLDLYSGVGTLGIALGQNFKQVFGVELFAEAAEYSGYNARQNALTNSTWLELSVESSLSQLPEADLLIVDPPRAGLSEKVLDYILGSLPQQILYVSCNPETQLQNVVRLQAQYQIQFIKAYNLYPHTPHVEQVMFLSKN